MSARNGDKSRFGRQRKQKIARRLVLRQLRTPDPGAPKTAATTESNPAETQLAGSPAAE
jgi:hypothetical protein